MLARIKSLWSGGDGTSAGASNVGDSGEPDVRTSTSAVSSNAPTPFDDHTDDMEVHTTGAGGEGVAEEKATKSPTSNAVHNMKGVGTVTIMENCMPKGVIDGMYYFTVEHFQDLIRKGLGRGTKVKFEASKSDSTVSWEVTSMELYLTPEQVANEDKRRYKTIIGRVAEFRAQDRAILLRYGKTNDDVQEVPYAALPEDYVVIKGDFLKVKIESYDINEEEGTGRIISVEPTKKETLVGKVTRNHRGQLSVDNRIYFEEGVCRNGRVGPHDIVRVVAVESKYDPGFNWRAISIHKSNFTAYTASNQPNEAWLQKENVWTDPLADLMKDKEGIAIEPKKLINFGGVRLGARTEIMVKIMNKTTNPIPLKPIHDLGDQFVCKFNIIYPWAKECDEYVTMIEPNSTFDLKISCEPKQLGGTRELCIFDFGHFKIGRSLVVVALSDQDDLVEAIRTEKKPHATDGFKWQNMRSEEVVGQAMEDRMKTTIRAAAPIVRTPFFQARSMEAKTIPSILWEIVKNADDNQIAQKFPNALKELRIETYQDKFELALWLEEIENDILRRQHDVKNTILEKSKNGEYFKFEVPGLRDIHPPIQIGDPVTIHDHNETKKKYTTNVYDIRGNYIYIKFENRDEKDRNNYVTVQFNLSRTNYKRCHHAVMQAEKYLGEEWLFPSEEISLKPPRIPFYEEDDTSNSSEEEMTPDNEAATAITDNKLFVKKMPRVPKAPQFGNSRSTNRRMKSTHGLFVSDTKGPKENSVAIRLNWFNRSLNKEQRDAVRRILRGQARPLPYIIYGPPGTGKTVTVVEALIQIYKLDPNSRILVVAPSNAAADVIAEHLVKSDQFVPGDFVRLVGFLRQEIQIPDTIRDYCVDGEYLETVARYRMIVSTCTTAGQFFTLGLDTQGHFTHVFIDEAGYCTEPEAVIPATLCALSKEGQIILAGDPKQLGPVLMSDAAAKIGLSLSLLERLMSLPLYSRNVEKFPEEKYNPIVLTKLVKNYRAHPTLLNLPSKLFYDDELESAVDLEEFGLCHDLEFLEKSKGVPLLFHGIQGRSERDEESPSWYNKAEAMQVVQYVRHLKNNGLSNEEIGIITPYRKQVEKIRRAMELGLLVEEVPKVGSVEEFQGGERKVMIMSLVRSVQQNQTDKIIDRMSFVFSPKRFNVAITRAKSLLIVIGNPHIMAYDRNWSMFLNYCIDLDCYVGCNLPLHLDQKTQQYLEELKIDNDENQLKLFQRPVANFTEETAGGAQDETWA